MEIKKMNVSSQRPVCELHGGQPLNIYCKTDQKLLCGICATKEAYDEQMHSKETLLQGFNKRQSKLLSCLKSLHENKNKVLDTLSMESEKIHVYFEKVQRMLEQKKSSIHTEFDKAKRDFMQAYDPRINKTNTLLADMDNFRKSAENLKVKSDPLRFLHKVQECRHCEICEVKEVPIPLVPNLAVSPHMKNVDTNALNTTRLADVHKMYLSKSPKRKPNPWSQILHRVRTVSVGMLLFSVILAATSSGSSDNHYVIVNEYKHLASCYPSNVTGKATMSIAACWWQTAEEILCMTRRCQSDVAEFASRLTKGLEILLLLGMEIKKAAPVSPIVKINE
ncbi:E3 ubiquitin- ligase TRIM13 isoform X2, partial [Pelobates cultripes]